MMKSMIWIEKLNVISKIVKIAQSFMFYDLPWLCIYNGRRESRKCQGHKLPHISKTNHATLYVCFILTIKIKPFFRQFSKIRGGSRAQMCHEYHELYYWRKKCHVEIFGLSIKNLNNLWSFIKVYAIFVPNLCGEKSAWRKSACRKNDKYEVYVSFYFVDLHFVNLHFVICTL